jgi:AcrR family transcriptional regulator
VAERTGRGAGLSREKVLAAALAIADEEGLDALSFRRLGAHFAVTPMALYRYVASKDALIDGIGDLVLGELELPDGSGGGDWRDELRAAARSFRALLVAHPAAARIFYGRTLFTPAGLRAADAILGLLGRAGFPPEAAVLRYQQVVRFVLSLVMLETTTDDAVSTVDPEEAERLKRLTFESQSPERYPNLVAAAACLAAPFDADAFFESGLELVVAGLERMRAAP